jgi:hypothetical protein
MSGTFLPWHSSLRIWPNYSVPNLKEPFPAQVPRVPESPVMFLVVCAKSLLDESERLMSRPCALLWSRLSLSTELRVEYRKVLHQRLKFLKSRQAVDFLAKGWIYHMPHGDGQSANLHTMASLGEWRSWSTMGPC